MRCLLVGRVGIEPTTVGLKDRCSTTELPALMELYSEYVASSAAWFYHQEVYHGGTASAACIVPQAVFRGKEPVSSVATVRIQLELAVRKKY